MENNTIALVLEAKTGSTQKALNTFIAKNKAEGVEIASDKLKNTSVNSSYKIQTNLTESDKNPWDLAHDLYNNSDKKGVFIEPDLLREFIPNASMLPLNTKGFGGNNEDPNWPFDNEWPPFKVEGETTLPNPLWHKGDEYSQLSKALNEVINLHTPAIRIGHLDTGYIIGHAALPTNFIHERTFIEDEMPQNKAFDRQTASKNAFNGHGTGTMLLLAGGKYTSADGSISDEYIGGYPFADIIPCRISQDVILLRDSEFVAAVDYLIDDLNNQGFPIHIITMSMGGSASRQWVRAVNKVYEHGITMFSASGDCLFGKFPRHVVYPARFNRVVAVTGATNDFGPYHNSKSMIQGNYGPRNLMGTAIAGFSPNVPWRNRDEISKINFDGAGTSAATPQVAAAAAMYYKKYYNELQALPMPWMRVEAIRHALFSKASKFINYPDDPDCEFYFGQGTLRAADALGVKVDIKNLAYTEADTFDLFPELMVIFKNINHQIDPNLFDMFNIEALQLVDKDEELFRILSTDNGKGMKSFKDLSKTERKAFLDCIMSKDLASAALKKFIADNNDFLIEL